MNDIIKEYLDFYFNSYQLQRVLSCLMITKLWKAIKHIFSKVLPNGQAKVFGKLLAGISLTSTERNTKRQLRDKICRTSKLLELWDDLKDLV